MIRSLLWMPKGGPHWFPPVEEASAEGLLMAGGDLSPERLIFAYTHGIFPWYEEDSSILWWAPDPRCVLFPGELRIPSRLARSLRRRRFSFTVDSAFRRVIHACASVPRHGAQGTWIVPEMEEAYIRLYELGFAHSVEVWEDGVLVGGLYGVQYGRAFSGESMFHFRSDASKAAVVFLVQWLQGRGVEIIDCQQASDHMLRLGAREISRREFQRLLSEFCCEGQAPLSR